MITLFNSKSIYIGHDQTRFNEIRNILDERKIEYKYKVRNRAGKMNGRGTTRANMGSVGNPSELMYEYEILIHKNDSDKIKV